MQFMHKLVLEKTIESKVCNYAKKLGFLVYKILSPTSVGIPDRMFIYNKLVFFIEFKKPGGVISAKQNQIFNNMSSHSINVYIVNNLNQGIFIIDEIFNKQRFT